MPAAIAPTEHELERRTGDGIQVRLLWDAADGRVTVAVDDRKTGDAFRIEVGPRDRALDVFHHPYAYAAWRGIDTASAIAASVGGRDQAHGEGEERHAGDAVERA